MAKNDDPRIGKILSSNPSPEKAPTTSVNIGLLGFPCDEGVQRNGGRIGSALGPRHLRQYLRAVGPLINPEYNIDISNTVFNDFGDITEDSLENMHKALTNQVESILELNYFPILIGGGNDQSYCNAKGLMNYLQHGDIGVINIDAHLDVRPLIGEEQLAHSGSPFRQLLNDNEFSGEFVEFAAQGNQCSQLHAKFVTSKDGKIEWLSRVKRKGAVSAFNEVLDSFPFHMPVFLSFDIDSIQSSDCPGVSCPGTIGISATDALDICFAAGERNSIKLLDFSEYNPKIESYRTGRLLATMIYYFIMGRQKK